MKKLSSFLFFVGVGLALAACSTPDSSTSITQEAMGRAAIVVTGTPRLDVAKPSTISWLGSLGVVGKHQTLGADELRQRLTQVINQQIMAKGYPVAGSDGDFQLDGVIVLAGAEDESTLLRESGGMDPGLAGIHEALGKGTLVLELKQGRVTRWKGTVQIYIAPHFDEVIALRRIEYAVGQLLGTWP